MGFRDETSYFNYIVAHFFRLYPPVPITLREALNDDSVAGYYIPKGTIMQLSQGPMMRYTAPLPISFLPLFICQKQRTEENISLSV